MIDIQIPVKLYGGQAADTPLHEELFHALTMGRIAIIVRHGDVTTGARLRVEDGLTFGLVRRQRLLGDDVRARFHRANNQIVMGAVHRCDDDALRLRFLEHFIEINKGGTARSDVALREGEPPRIDVAEPDEFDNVAVVLLKVFTPHIDTADAGANHRDARFRRQAGTEHRRGTPRDKKLSS